jgi:hypothetical protein
MGQIRKSYTNLVGIKAKLRRQKRNSSDNIKMHTGNTVGAGVAQSV